MNIFKRNKINRENMLKAIQDYKNDDLFPTFIESSDDNSCTIILDLASSPIYQAYSSSSMLNDEIFNFVEDSFRIVRKKDHINLKIIYPEGMDEVEKNKIVRLFKAHYASKYIENREDIKRTKIFAWISLAIGAALLIAKTLLSFYKLSFLFDEIIDIFAWVFIWESCDLFTFTNNSNRMKEIRYLRLFNINII